MGRFKISLMRNFLHKIFHYLLDSKKKHKNHRAIPFGHEKKVLIIKNLNEIMEQKQPFLNETYNLKALADEVKLHQYQLSAFLNHEAAKVELKNLMPEDAKEAIGHGIRAKRSKSGAISFDLQVAEVGHAALH